MSNTFRMVSLKYYIIFFVSQSEKYFYDFIRKKFKNMPRHVRYFKLFDYGHSKSFINCIFSYVLKIKEETAILQRIKFPSTTASIDMKFFSVFFEG